MAFKGTNMHILEVQSCHFKGQTPVSSFCTPKGYNFCTWKVKFKDAPTYKIKSFTFHLHLSVATGNRRDVETKNAPLDLWWQLCIKRFSEVKIKHL